MGARCRFSDSTKQRCVYTAAFLSALLLLSHQFDLFRGDNYPEKQQTGTGLHKKETNTRQLGEVLELDRHSKATSSLEGKHAPEVVPRKLVPSGTEEPIQCLCDPFHIDPASKHPELLAGLDPFWGMSMGESLSRHHPNLLVSLRSDTTLRCSLMPNTFDIAWTGVHWQGYGDAQSEPVLLYSAFYDNRPSKDTPLGSIRILAMLTGSFEELPWCHLWYSGQLHPVVSEVIRMDYLDYQDEKEENMRPYSFICAVRYMDKEKEKEGAVPSAVSLVSAPCTLATNVLKVIGKPVKEVPHFKQMQQPSKQLPASDPQWRVGVCGPALYYVMDDTSIRIVEWLELLKTLGVSQVFLYQTDGLHPNISKVLQYYEKEGFVEVVDFHYPPPFMDHPLLRKSWRAVKNKFMFAMENIYFTDCVLRYKDRYRFLAHVDPDEMPVLLQHDSLPELMAHLTSRFSNQKRPPPGYKLKWSFFPLMPSTQGSPEPPQPSDDGVMQYLTILRNSKRVVVNKKPNHGHHKTIYDTHYVTGVFSHSTLHCTWGECDGSTSYKVPIKTAFLGHFRYACVSQCNGSKNRVEVPQVVRHREEVLPKIERVLRQLALIPLPTLKRANNTAS